MSKLNRRNFLQSSTGALAATVGLSAAPAKNTFFNAAILKGAYDAVRSIPPLPADEGKKPLRLGLIIDIGNDPNAAMAKVRDLGLPTAQIFVSKFESGLAARLRQALDESQIEATALVVGGPGKEVWDFYQGPLTIGLVPPATRAARIAQIKKASDFAKECGIPAVQTHCGFIPENPNDSVYAEAVAAIRDVVNYCQHNGQNFRYETGQETPITLVRAIQDVGLGNQGVNFDLANLILYGKANPADAIEIIGPYVQGIHAKDGLWPTNPKQLGEEVPIGKGKVDFSHIVERLKQLNYRGAVTIEREISGPEQIEDVRASKTYLEKLIG